VFNNSGFTELEKKKLLLSYSSGNKVLDEILNGGFRQDLIYLLYGDKRTITTILQKTAVLTFKDRQFSKKVVYIDCNNHFNPYNISKLAVRETLSPVNVLKNILISRAFTWEQMVEVLENRISCLDNVKILMVSGLTAFWPDYELKSFEQLLQALSGIKHILFKTAPLIILTCPSNAYSEIKPQGGKYLAHFGNVLVAINRKERYIEYRLIQHPSLPEERIIERTPSSPKRGRKIPLKNATIDQWF
jgi:hypothetical protein